jgi:hypothetical protein
MIGPNNCHFSPVNRITGESHHLHLFDRIKSVGEVLMRMPGM